MKNGIILIAALCVGLAFSGPVIAEELTIVGTGSGMPLLEATGEAFTIENQGITIHIPKSIGSGGGVKAVGTGKNLIGRVARKIKDKEKHYGLTYAPFAKMPIIFFVNKSVGVSNLTTQQVCDIYSGKITNWKAVGGKDAKIRVIRREDGDSSLSVLLKSFPGFADIMLTSKSKTTYTDQDTCLLAASKANTIAFGTYINAKNYNVDVVSIDGKHPSQSDYPYTGTLALIYKEKNKKGAVKKFLEFAASATARKAIKEAGGIPI
jgi:phosphate transport system substrate-binding protein